MQLSQQKCRRHASREAVARCPECNNFFCRECVTEHDGRLICSDCLSKLTETTRKSSPFFRWIFRGGWGFVSFLLVWFLFYGLGQFLLALPSAFHEGTFWTEKILADVNK
jgi:hypothetical protein